MGRRRRGPEPVRGYLQSKVSGPQGRASLGRVQPAFERNEGPTKTQRSPEKPVEAAAGAHATQPQLSGKGSGGGSSVRRFGEDCDGRGAERPASALGRAL